MPLYSQMTQEELQCELDKLRDQGQAAFDEQRWNEYEVLMQKWYLAKSYQVRSHTNIELGRTYRLAEEDDQLTVTKLEGIMAWGIRLSNGREAAFPLAMLVTNEGSHSN